MPFEQGPANLAKIAAAVPPSDTDDLPGTAEGLWVVTGGTLSVISEGDTGQTGVSLGAVAAGTLIPLRVRRVMATGTTATVAAFYSGLRHPAPVPGLFDDRVVVLSRGAMNTVTRADVPAGQRATLCSSRMIAPWSPVAPDPVQGIQFVFWGGYLNGVAGEAALTHTITFRAGFEANGQTKALTFGGNASVTIAANATGAAAMAISDPIFPADNGYAGAWPTTGSAFIRTDCTVPSSGLMPGHNPAGGTGEGVRFSADIGVFQHANTGALATPSGAFSFGFAPAPAAIIGKWAGAKLPSFGILGDSIADGQGDTADDGLSATTGGMMLRAMRSAGVPYCKLTRGADAYISISLTSKWAARRYLARFCTDIIDEFGINGSAPSAAGELAYARSYYLSAYQSGVLRIAKTSITASGGSSDSWATKAGQTPYQVAGGVQDQVNIQMRAAAGAFVGPDAYINTRSAMSDLTDNFRWRTNGTANFMTADGVHPSAAGHAAGAVPLLSYVNGVKALYA